MSTQGTVYATFIEAELKAERDRRASLDTRGVTVVTTAGSLVTLLTAIAAFVKPDTGKMLPGSALVVFALALVAFAVAAGFGIAACWNKTFDVAKSSTLDKMVHERWEDNEVDARNIVATANWLSVASLRKANNFKSNAVSAGLISLAVALVLLGVVVFMMVRAY